MMNSAVRRASRATQNISVADSIHHPRPETLSHASFGEYEAREAQKNVVYSQYFLTCTSKVDWIMLQRSKKRLII
ncbi:MAG TPA: hypothetical protein VKB53_10195 [Gammaproteobacteria bacterium]|jgi:hypothetical protein|nr:hypothetical protein [Gammaproteobacteria bacterium]